MTASTHEHDANGETNPWEQVLALGSQELDQNDCSQMVARLYHFLDGELTSERRNTISGHLDKCSSCLSVFDFETELRNVIAAKCRTVVPPALIDKIRDATIGATFETTFETTLGATDGESDGTGSAKGTVDGEN